MSTWIGGYAAIAGLTWVPFTVFVLRGPREQFSYMSLAGLLLAIGWPVTVPLWVSSSAIDRVRRKTFYEAALLDDDGSDLLNPLDRAP